MSVELVKEQIRRFLSTDTPEVLAIKGDWGVGKTYSWEKYIEEFKSECALKSYSYVSLFGINSIAELKQTTFLNTIDTKRIGEAPNIKGYSKKVADLVKDTKIPYVSKYVGGIGSLINSVSQLAMNKTIICFDDLERHSKGITIKDFMGLVSFFKEQKGCKVVLLLNEEAGDDTFKDYRKYKEKIVDRQLHFEPTAEQCFDIMFADDFEFRDYVRDCCIGLNIKNKRVIRKIVEHTNEFLELVDDFDESIKKQVIHSTIVLSWCYYCHGADEVHIPEFAFVNQSGTRKENEESGWTKEITVRWNMTLNRYGYGYTDEIDLAVARGIEQGFLDKEKLIPLCRHKQKEVEIQHASAKWDEAWKLFHGSFDANEEEVAEAMEAGMRDIATSTSCSQYSSGLMVLRELRKDKKADELIDVFVKARKENPEIFNVDSIVANPFGIKDEKFKEKLKEAYLEFEPKPTVEEILEERKGSNSYNTSEVEIFNELSTEKIEEMFRGFKGDDLTSNIRTFMLLSSSSPELGKKVGEVLDRIASTELNKSRMAKFRR
ncbi:KAP family NTPase [Vibrio splendidus]|uniref:KAP family NTPase n=1 Tax=Vibrio splendidus TaxID=29497 RepID=UPI002235631B|nr:KAP family NTPase [Vibrio splendidus]MCW4438078.1 KAP family NTPase [Vibrio splendidus]